jgi:hypothetical protein
VLYNSFCITIGSSLKTEKESFSNFFNICLKAEYVFVLKDVVKLLYLSSFKDLRNLYDLDYTPCSILNLFREGEIPIWLIYFMQTINIWEILFCAVGTSLYALELNISINKAIQLFCIPYLFGLMIWLFVISFLALQFT